MRAFFDIDTQIDFMFPAGALYTKGAEQLLPAIAQLNTYAVKNGIALISTVCCHDEDAAEFKVWPPHCVRDTFGQRKPASTLAGPTQHIVEKNELDLFSNPTLVPLLDSLGIGECFVYGVLVEYCVKCAVMGLLRTGRKVSLVTDATLAYDAAAGQKVIDEFTAAGGTLTTLAAISPAAAPAAL
jgi:nicotinamidase/pyrazinamidase